MREVRQLKNLGAAILLLGLLMGTIASASESSFEVKESLESFLEKFIVINPLSEKSPFFKGFETPQWQIEINRELVVEEGSYTVKFIPLGIKELQKDSGGYYHVVLVIHRNLFITPKRNIRIDGQEITLLVEVLVTASFENLERLSEFLEEILLAMDEGKEVSIEIKIPSFHGIIRPIDKETVEEEVNPNYQVSFYKK